MEKTAKFEIAYVEAMGTSLSLLQHLTEKLENFPAPDSDDANWGHVGTLNHISQQIRDLLESLI